MSIEIVQSGTKRHFAKADERKRLILSVEIGPDDRQDFVRGQRNRPRKVTFHNVPGGRNFNISSTSILKNMEALTVVPAMDRGGH